MIIPGMGISLRGMGPVLVVMLFLTFPWDKLKAEAVTSGATLLPHHLLQKDQKLINKGEEAMQGTCVKQNYKSRIERIVAGNYQAKKGQVPYHVSIQVTDGEFHAEHICSGAILSEKVAITVASCFDAQPLRGYYQVVAGEHDLEVEEGIEQKRRFSRFIVHPNYSPLSEDEETNNVALIFLREPLVFNDFVRSVKLPNKNEIYDMNEMELTVSGWTTVRSFYATRTRILQVMDLLTEGPLDRPDIQEKETCTLQSSAVPCARPVLVSETNYQVEQGSPIVSLELNILFSIHVPHSTTNFSISSCLEWIKKILFEDEL